MIVTTGGLERRVAELNQWLLNHPNTHHLYAQKEQRRNYYVSKLGEMDEYKLSTIKIN